MTCVRAASPGGLRVILCFKFNQRASFKELADFKRSLISKEQVLHSVEVSGSFDFMVEAEQRDLTIYQSLLDELIKLYGHLIDHYEASFVCRRYLRDNESSLQRQLWVPTASGLRRIKHDQIDKITAEGDYVRLYSGSASWLLHTTMKSISEKLDSALFLQLNRSLIVRADCIDRLIHHHRRWTARLLDGSEHNVAKSRSSAVVGRLKSDSSNTHTSLSESDQITELETKATENLVH